MAASDLIPVIDLFAGPGGLGEGFSAARFPDRRASGRQRPFRIALSIEKDPDAHATLMLRSFFRQFTLDARLRAKPGGRPATGGAKRHASRQGFAARRVPEAYYDHLRGELTRDDLYTRYPAEARLAAQEAWHAELGGPAAPPDLVGQRIRASLAAAKAWVLIGGPPNYGDQCPRRPAWTCSDRHEQNLVESRRFQPIELTVRKEAAT